MRADRASTRIKSMSSACRLLVHLTNGRPMCPAGRVVQQCEHLRCADHQRHHQRRQVDHIRAVSCPGARATGRHAAGQRLVRLCRCLLWQQEVPQKFPKQEQQLEGLCSLQAASVPPCRLPIRSTIRAILAELERNTPHYCAAAVIRA